jgi:hypothetical protein
VRPSKMTVQNRWCAFEAAEASLAMPPPGRAGYARAPV